MGRFIGPRAYGQIHRTKRLIFLGFGYDKTNLSRLKLDELSPPPSIFGSCLGFTPKEREELSRRVRIGIQLGQPENDALQFLRNNLSLAE